MDYLSAVSLFIFQIVCINITAISSDQKQQLADTLDRLLKCPGWKDITARAKYQNAAHEIESFTGKDLYLFDLDLNEEYEVIIGKKYDMIIHLLGCVYTNAMLTFLNLLDMILSECREAKTRTTDNADKPLIRDCAKQKIDLTSEERPLASKDSVDNVNFKTVFDTAMEQLENSILMLDAMSSALRYLIGLAPLDKIQNELIQDIKRISDNIDEIKYKAVYHRFTIPRDNTTCKDEEYYNKNIKTFSDKVSRSIDINKKGPLVIFKNNRCILSVNERIEQLYRGYQSDVIIEEMEMLENEVFTSFYAYLGFEYDFLNQATILATDNIKNNVDTNNA